MPARILIVDDDSVIRRLLRRLVEGHQDWSVCGEAVNGFEAIDKIRQMSPDIVVMDLAMPQMNGIEAAREILRVDPSLPILLLTVQEISPHLVSEARHVGFKGAVSKYTGHEVVQGIEALLKNETFFGARHQAPPGSVV
jgi:DNA-binding NarL/FixJ family response regulator